MNYTPRITQIVSDFIIRVLSLGKSGQAVRSAESVRFDSLELLKPKNPSRKDSLLDLKGIWKDRDITIEQIRGKAWPRRN